MTFDTPVMANVLYLILVLGLWATALALVTPGTGVLELLALGAIAVSGFGLLTVPFNLWALPLLILGVAAFGLSLWRWDRGVWLVASAVFLSLGSVFLFRLPGQVIAVHPLLGAGVSLLTLGFFWLMIRKSMLAFKAPPNQSLSHVIGQTGEVRTTLKPVGSVYVDGELWSARSEKTIRVGSQVKVVGREGLILIVEQVEPIKTS